MKPITFDAAETKAIVSEIRDYFREELDQDIGTLPAEMLMTFFADKMGAYYYNRGVHDAQTALKQRMDSLHDDLYGLEQRTRQLR